MVAHLNMRTHRVDQAFRFVEGICSHRKSCQIRFLNVIRPHFITGTGSDYVFNTGSRSWSHLLLGPDSTKNKPDPQPWTWKLFKVMQKLSAIITGAYSEGVLIFFFGGGEVEANKVYTYIYIYVYMYIFVYSRWRLQNQFWKWLKYVSTPTLNFFAQDTESS